MSQGQVPVLDARKLKAWESRHELKLVANKKLQATLYDMQPSSVSTVTFDTAGIASCTAMSATDTGAITQYTETATPFHPDFYLQDTLAEG